MSAIAGIYREEALPTDAPARLAEMQQHLASIAPDGSRQLCGARVGMAFSAFHITSDSRKVPQPYQRGTLWVSWDGRLDNRTEVARRIASEAGTPVEPLTDVELVAHAYETLGDRAIGLLVGDFAVAIWDGRRQRLILARDGLGARPLFYRQDGETLYWGSTLGVLRVAGQESLGVDDRWLAAYLLRLVPADGTPYRDVRKIPAGHMLIVDRDGHHWLRHWTLGRHPEIRYRCDADYEEHFREIFFDAVRVRMRTGGAPLCCELSGGLDSSSIACVAHHLLRTESVEARDVLTYSIVYDRASTADEREFITQVEERLGKKGIHLLEDEHPMLAAGFERPWSEIPYFLQTLRAPHVYAGQRLAETGTRVVLTGAGGDQLLWNDVEAPYSLADLAMAGRYRELWHQLGKWRLRSARTAYPQPLPQLILRGLLQPVVASLWGRSKRYTASGLFAHLAGKLNSLHRKTWRANNPRLPMIRPSRLPPVEELRSVSAHVGWFYQFERLGFQMSHPYLHRPLVEFCLGIPNDQFVRVDETRSLQRRALRDLLPPGISSRYTKVGPDEAILRGFRREWSTLETLVEDSRACAMGLADQKLVHTALERASAGFAPFNMDLVRFLEVEIWLRGQELAPTGATAAA
jgi:asparagine synthase (glutamine-hydrolysing)